MKKRLRESSELPTLRELAAAAGVHPAHLTRVFRRAHGCSVGDWYRARRIERAAQELLLGESSLADVALRHGFCDQSHFNRVFGRLVGTSPGRYRSRTRAGRAAWMR